MNLKDWLAPRGREHIVVTGDGEPDLHIDWPRCAVDGCLNMACLRLQSPFCFPHTPGASNSAEMTAENEADIASAICQGESTGQ